MVQQLDQPGRRLTPNPQKDDSAVMKIARGDEEGATAEAVPDGAEEGSMQKYSLKLEDMASGTQGRSSDGWRLSFRRSKTPTQKRAPLQRTYSQYNLTQLGRKIVDESHHEILQGIYGLLARQIEVPFSVWEELPGGPKKAGMCSAASLAPCKARRRPSIFCLPLLHPYSRLAVAWRSAMLLFDLSFTAFWVPLNIGFCFTSYGDLRQRCTQSDLAGGIVYVINWIMGFQMGVVATCGNNRRVVVLDGMSVARVYCLYGKFVMDTLAVVPFLVLVSAIGSPHDGPVGPGRRLWSLLSLMRLVRLVRLFNTVKVVYKDSVNVQYQSNWVSERISVPLMFLLILGYQFLVVINLCASLMVLLATYYGVAGAPTWFGSMKWVNFEAASPPLLWYHAAYWVITVLTTTGQGQAPRQLGEQVVANFCSVYGMVFSGLVAGVVGDKLMRASGDASALLRSRRNVARATSWASLRRLRPGLTRELQVFFADSELAHRDSHLACRDFTKEAAYLEDLPTSLRRSVLEFIVDKMLAEIPLFKNVDPELRGLLASMFRPVDVPPNHDLCRQGTSADRLWLLEWGTVVALRHKEAEAHPTTGMKCLLGETVLLRGMVEAAGMRPWTFRTTSMCRLWELHWADIERLLRVEPCLVAAVMQYVRERLIFKLDGVPERDCSWCELVVVLSRTLKQPQMLDCAQDNLLALVQSRVDDGSLPLLLSAWLEAGIATSLELGLPAAGRKRDLVTMSLLARQSNGATGPGSNVNSYGAAFHYPLAAPSPAIMSRYGPARVGSGFGGLACMSTGIARGPFRGGGAPASPLRFLPSAAPAILARQPSGGSGEVVGPGVRSPGPSDELAPGWLLTAVGFVGGDGGGSTEMETTGGRPTGQKPIAKRCRSFNHDADAGTAATAASAQPLSSSQSHSHPGLGGPGASGSRQMPRRSRMASTAPSRRAPWAEAVSTAAVADSIRSRRPSGRASFSDNGGATGSRSAAGADGRAAGVGANAVADDGGGYRVGTDSPDDDDCVRRSSKQRRLSLIAHTHLAYKMVDAGGVPMASPTSAASGASGPGPATATAASASSLSTLAEAFAVAVEVASSASSTPALIGRSDSRISAANSPRASPAGGGGGGGGDSSPSLSCLGSSGGGGSSPYQGSQVTVYPAVQPLVRTRSAQSLYGSGGSGCGGGGMLPTALRQTSSLASGADAAATTVNDRVSAPANFAAALVGRRRLGTPLCLGAGGAAEPLARRRGVSRSRSASLLGQRPPLPPMMVAATPSLPRVREEGTVSGSGAARGSHSGADSTSSGPSKPLASAAEDAAAAVAPSDSYPFEKPPLPPSARCTGTSLGGSASVHSVLRPGRGAPNGVAVIGHSPPPVAPGSGGATAGITGAASEGGAAGTVIGKSIRWMSGAGTYPAPRTLPGAAVGSGGGAVTASGDISGAPVSDRLSQLPLPDRVLRLRLRTGTPPAAAMARSQSVGNADTRSWPQSPLAAAAAVAPVAACAAPSLCATCGKCTCAACRARALTAAQALERGMATVASGFRAPPYSPHLVTVEAGGSRGAGAPADRPPFEVVRAAASAAAAATGSVYGIAAASVGGRAPGVVAAPVAPWARGAGGGAGRGPETWRRRRNSVIMDLSMPSVPLVPY